MSESEYDAKYAEKAYDRRYVDNGGPTFKHTVYVARNNRWCFIGICKEALDNSNEAGATHIFVNFKFEDDKLKTMILRDNGKGIPNLMEISRFGYDKKNRNSIGRYGRGIKESTIAKFNKIKYISVWYGSDGIKYTQRATWNIKDMVDENEYRPILSSISPVDDPQSHTGLTIVLEDPIEVIDQRQYSQISLEDEIAWRFNKIILDPKYSLKSISFNYEIVDNMLTRSGKSTPTNTHKKKVIDSDYYEKYEVKTQYPERKHMLTLWVNPNKSSQIVITWADDSLKTLKKHRLLDIVGVGGAGARWNTNCNEFVLGSPPPDFDKWVVMKIYTDTFYKDDINLDRKDKKSKQGSIQVMRNDHMITTRRGIQSLFRITNGDLNKLQFRIAYDNCVGDCLLGCSYVKQIDRIPDIAFSTALEYILRKVKAPWLREMNAYEKTLKTETPKEKLHSNMKVTKSSFKNEISTKPKRVVVTEPEVVVEEAAGAPIDEESNDIVEKSEGGFETTLEADNSSVSHITPIVDTTGDDSVTVTDDRSEEYRPESVTTRIKTPLFYRMGKNILEHGNEDELNQFRLLINKCYDMYNKFNAPVGDVSRLSSSFLKHIETSQMLEVVNDIYKAVYTEDQLVKYGAELVELHKPFEKYLE